MALVSGMVLFLSLLLCNNDEMTSLVVVISLTFFRNSQ